MTKQPLWRQLSLFLVIVMCSPIAALMSYGQIINDGEAIPLDPNVRYGKLKNGFTYYIQKNDNSKGLELRLLVKVGMLNVDDEQRDLAHLLEHVGFRGMRQFPRGIREDLYAQGFKGTVRATTAEEHTTYYIETSDNSTINISLALKVLHDWASGFRLNPEEIEAERKVVLAERLNSETPSSQRTTKLYYNMLDHPKYSPASRDAGLENIRNLKVGAANRFYEEWYVPARQAAIIVGNIDVDEIENQIKSQFSDAVNHANPPVPKRIANDWAVPLKGGNQIFVFAASDIMNARIEIFMKRKARIPFDKPVTRKHFGICVKDALFNTLIKQRLGRISGCEPLFKTINAQIQRSFVSRLSDVDVMHTSAELSSGESLEAGLRMITKKLETIRRNGFTEDELAVAKQLYKSDRLGYNRTNRFIADRLTDHFLFGSAVPSEPYENQLIDSVLNNITADEMNASAARWLNFEQNADVVLYTNETEKSTLPKKDSIREWINESRELELAHPSVTQNTDGAVELPELPELASVPSSSDYQSKQFKRLGITKLELPNGVRVILKSFKPSGLLKDKIMIQGFSPGGALLYSEGNYFSALHAAEIVAASGLQRMNPCQLSTLLKEKEIRLAPYISDTEEGVFGYSSENDFPILLDVLYRYFRYPTVDKQAYQNWLAKNKETTRKKEGNLKIRFNEAATRAAIGLPVSSETTLSKVNMNDAFQIYKERFSDAGGFQFVITGDFDEKKLEPIVVKYLSNLPSPDRKEAPQVNQAYRSKFNSYNFYSQGKGTLTSVKIALASDVARTKKNVVTVAILEELLDAAIEARLRKKEGETYYVSVTAGYTGSGDSFHTMISFNCRTAAKDQLIAATLEEIRKLRTAGSHSEFLQGSIAKAKEKYQQSLQNNQFWLHYLCQQLRTHENLTNVLGRGNLFHDFQTGVRKLRLDRLLNFDGYQLFLLQYKAER